MSTEHGPDREGADRREPDSVGPAPGDAAADPAGPQASRLPAFLRTFCDAAERRDGAALAALFTDNGVYHDLFYGAFRGRARIAELIDDWFHRDATEFRWDMHDPVFDGRTLYVRYTFSWRSLLPEANGAGRCSKGWRSCGWKTA